MGSKDSSDILPEEPYILHETWLTKPITELSAEGEPSKPFKINDHTWKIIIFPKGYKTQGYLSVILMACKITNTRKVKFSIKTIGGKKIAEESTEFAFSKVVPNRGFPNFIPLPELNDYATPNNQLNLDLTIEFLPKASTMGSAFRKTTGYVGLKPCEKSFFMNSFIQIMFHLNSFSLEILKQKKQQNSPEFEAIQNLFTLLQMSPIAPSTSEINQIIGFNDEDDWIQKNFQSLFFKFFNSCQKLIRDTFLIKVNEYTKQQSMHNNSAQNNKKPLFSLQINSEKQKFSSLNSFLDNYTNPNKESGTNSDEEITAVRFASLPPVLIISLNPFQNIQDHPKTKGRFSYPFELDMTPYMEDQKISTKYELFGVIAHQGEKFDGHFFTICRPSENRNWLKFDDTFVSIANERNALDDLYGSAYQNTSALLLSYIRKDKISEIMKKTEYSNIPDSAIVYYQKWNESHRESYPSVDLQIFTVKDYQDKIQEDATIDTSIESSIQLEKVPDNLLYNDILYQIQRVVGLKAVSLWELDHSLLPFRLLPLTTPVKSIRKVFVSSQKEGKVPLLIGYFDPDHHERPKVLSIVSFEALDEKSSPSIALQRLRQTLSISLEEKMACFIYHNNGKAKRISIASPIGKKNHGIIIFQNEKSDNLNPQTRSIDILPEFKKQRSFPQYLEFIKYSGKITALSVDTYRHQTDDKIEFEISMRDRLFNLMRCLRILLNLPDSDSIFLFKKENNRPSRKPLNLNEGGTISQFLVGNSVFYKIVRGISQEKISEASLFQCTVIGEKLNIIEKSYFVMSQIFKVSDVIHKYLTKNDIDISEKSHFRIVQLNGPRIICSLDDDSVINDNNNNLEYRIEFVPNSQANIPSGRLLRVTFSTNDKIPSNNCFGFPFFLRLYEEESFESTLNRINQTTSLALNFSLDEFSFLYSNDVSSSVYFVKLDAKTVLKDICTGKRTMLYIVPNDKDGVTEKLSQMMNADVQTKMYI